MRGCEGDELGKTKPPFLARYETALSSGNGGAQGTRNTINGTGTSSKSCPSRCRALGDHHDYSCKQTLPRQLFRSGQYSRGCGINGDSHDQSSGTHLARSLGKPLQCIAGQSSSCPHPHSTDNHHSAATATESAMTCHYACLHPAAPLPAAPAPLPPHSMPRHFTRLLRRRRQQLGENSPTTKPSTCQNPPPASI